MIKLRAKLLNKQAAGYPRLMQIMHGQVPSVHTFGILSADNPQNTPLTPAENEKRRDKFKEMLKRGNYGYVQHSGVYNRWEHSFFIMNVSKQTFLTWADSGHLDQESVIFGTVDAERKKVTFEYIENGQTLAIRQVVLHQKDDVDNFYSTYKGRKFQIPFFDEAYEPNKEDSNIPLGAPFQEKDLVGHEANLTHLATIDAYREQIRRTATGETVDGRNAWGHRGMTLAALNKLKVN